RLRAAGVAVALLDLTGVGQNLTPEQWYIGLLLQLGESLDMEDELEAFWFEHDHVSPLQRWMAAIREVALAKRAGPVTIFLDEIARPLLKRSLHWTGGHPYLTQRLCAAVAGDPTLRDARDVDRLCDELFLSTRARERDDNLLFVRRGVLEGGADKAAALDLYA